MGLYPLCVCDKRVTLSINFPFIHFTVHCTRVYEVDKAALSLIPAGFKILEIQYNATTEKRRRMEKKQELEIKQQSKTATAIQVAKDISLEIPYARKKKWKIKEVSVADLF